MFDWFVLLDLSINELYVPSKSIAEVSQQLWQTALTFLHVYVWPLMESWGPWLCQPCVRD